MHWFILLVPAILCKGVQLTELRHVILVPSTASGGYIWSLPNEGYTEYHQALSHHSSDTSRFRITLDGRIFVESGVGDLIGKSVTVAVNVRNVITGSKSLHHFSFDIVDAESEHPSKQHRREKRAIDIAITKQVNETVSEISLDYGAAGVVKNVNNRYYMANDEDTPLIVDATSGRLLLRDNARRLDYETAPNGQYKFVIYVNNSLSNIGKSSNITD